MALFWRDHSIRTICVSRISPALRKKSQALRRRYTKGTGELDDYVSLKVHPAGRTHVEFAGAG